MKFCPNCGTLTYEETEICPGCGEPFRDIKRYCPNCGNEFSPGDHYCMYCGADVSGIPSMLNGSTDKRSGQKPKKPKRHRIRRFLTRLLEILLILAAILWCVAYYEDYDLRQKVYDTIQSASQIIPSVRSVLGISEEPPIIAEPDMEDPIEDDETVIVETPGDARKVDIITIVVVNRAKEAALEAEERSEDDIDPGIEADGEGPLPERTGPGRPGDEDAGPGQGRPSERRRPGEEAGYPPEFGEDDDFGDISEFRVSEMPEDQDEPDESGGIAEFRSFRESEESDGSEESDEPEDSEAPDGSEMPGPKERRHERQRPSRHRSDRPPQNFIPPQDPKHKPGEAGSGSDSE